MSGIAARVAAMLGVTLAILAIAPSAGAHKPSDALVTLTIEAARVTGRWDIALRDADYALALDADGDGALTWGEVETRGEDLDTWALGRLKLDADGRPCPLTAGEHRMARHSDGAYLVLLFTAACAAPPRELAVRYDLLFDLDAQHRGLLRVTHPGGTDAATLSASTRTATFHAAGASRMQTLASFVGHGVHHIWRGFDHLAFLLALLFPSVLSWDGRRWQAAHSLRPVLRDVLTIVTAFTAAHSITLSLSALELVYLPSRLVEAAIALSVVLAAVNNVIPIVRNDRWVAAFALGLLHGFGFSATLADLGLPRGDLALALFGFNLGVEMGQATVVVTLVPLAFAARRTAAYRGAALQGGSLAIAALGCLWLVERAFDVAIFS